MLAMTNQEMGGALQAVRAERDRLSAKLADLDQRAGEIAEQLTREDGISHSAIARRLGVSHTHVRNLIDRATSAGLRRNPEWLTPTMSGGHAVRYLETTRRSIARIIAGFDASDVLLHSGLHPQAFEQAAGFPVYPPNMLWQLDDGNWLGIDDVNVGYLGTGSTNAQRALENAGVPADLAHDVAYAYRFSVTDVTAEEIIECDKESPRYPGGLFVREGSAYVTKLDRQALAGRDRATSRRERNGETLSELEQWLHYLDGDCPAWMNGERVARVFMSTESARAQGFDEPHFVSGHGGPYPLIIEQGDLQLWIPFYPPTEGPQLLSADMYQALAMANLYPEQIAQRDHRTRFLRYLDSRFGSQERPGFLDISRHANLTLRSQPRTPA